MRNPSSSFSRSAEAISADAQDAAHDSPYLPAFLGARVAALVVERIFPPRAVAVQPGEAVDVGKAPHEAGVKVGREKVLESG